MKNTRNKIRLSENQLHKLIKESIKKVMKEAYGEFNGDGVDSHLPNWEYLDDYEIEDLEKRHDNDKSWNKIDSAYRDRDACHGYDHKNMMIRNDSLKSNDFPDGVLSMGALGHYGDDFERFAKSYRGTACKDTPFSYTKKIKDDLKTMPPKYRDNKVLDHIEEEANPDIQRLSKMSRSYHPNMDGQKNIMNKTFNRGMGSIPFVEIMPDEKVLLVNKNFARKTDMVKIQQCFPEYTIEEVSLGYPDWYFHRNLRSMRGK